MALVVPADNRILYFARDRDNFGFLSHFYPAPIVLDRTTWPTVEHFYQAQKSFDRSYRLAILEAPSPGAAKRLAAGAAAPNKHRKYSWFLKNNSSPRADWGEVKLDIMRRGDLAKFTQHPDLADLLLATGHAELVEDSRSEPYWGIGRDGRGLNWAGRVLMEVRAILHHGGPHSEGLPLGESNR